MNPSRKYPPHRRRLLGAILCLLAAGLTIVATFLPLLDIPGDENYYTAWGFVEGSHVSPPMYGPPLVVAAVVLLAAAVALLVSALPSVRLGTGRVAGATGLAGSAMLVGLTWAVVLHESSVIGNMAATVTDPSEEPVEVSLGTGVWLLVAGAVLAVVATVLALLPARPSLPSPAPQPGGHAAAAAQPYPAPWPGTVQNRPTQTTMFGR